jgi:hypothetical protein
MIDSPGEHTTSPKSPALAALYWRSEILQVMFWLRGEGFGDIVDAGLLERFLGVDATIGVTYLDRLVEENYLVADGPFYSLSDKGREEGAAEFASSFAELMRPTHGECSADCWCHQSPDEAEACSAARRHDHDDSNHNHH